MPGGLQGRPGSFPESLNFFINSQLRLKTGPDGPPGGPRKVLGVLPGNPRVPFSVDFGSILHVKKHRKNVKNIKEALQKTLDYIR